MRERLVAALVGMTVAVVALYGIPRAYLLADLVNTQETRKVERSVDLFAALVTERRARAAPVTEEFLEPLLHEAEGVEVQGADGSVVRAGEAGAGHEAGDIVRSHALSGGGRVTLARSRSLVDERVSDALLPLVLMGLGLAAVAAAVGVLLARRLSDPFRDLATAAEAIGQGRFDVPVAHYRVPEAEAIGEALRQGSAQLDSRLRHEREFAVNASHELRSPIAALRLELEDLAMWPQTPPDVAAELQSYLPELDRLSAAITQFLDTARTERLGTTREADLSAVLAEVADRWAPRLSQAGGVLAVHDDDGAKLRLTPDEGTRLLDLLLEDALARGHRRVTVSSEGSAGFVRVRVAGEPVGGTAPAGHPAPATTDHRSAAAALARSAGGTLTTDDAAGTTVTVTLPTGTPPPA